MKYTKNLNLNLPEGEDPLVVKDLSDNFETLDEVVAETQKMADPYKVGDIVTTWRTDLGDDWLLCNGELLNPSDYPELYKLTPGVGAFLGNSQNYSVECYVDGMNSSQYTFCAAYGCYFIAIYVKTNVCIDITNLITKEMIRVTTSITGLNSTICQSSNAIITNDGVFHYMAYDSGAGKACLVRCNGNPMVAEDWEAYIQQATSKPFANSSIFAILPKENDTYYIFYSNLYAKYKLISGILTIVDSGTVPVVPGLSSRPNFVTKNQCKVFNGSLYTMIFNSNTVKTLRLKDDMSAWDIMGEAPAATKYTSTTPFIGFADSNECVYFFCQFTRIYSDEYNNKKALYGDAIFTKVDKDGNFSVINIDNGGDSETGRHQNTIASMVLDTMNAVSPQVYKGKYYFVCTVGGAPANSAPTYATVAVLSDLSSETFSALTDADRITADGAILSNDTRLYVNSEPSDEIMVLGYRASISGSLPVYAIPNFAAPLISSPISYTYIKAKEATADANQQTDAPSA